MGSILARGIKGRFCKEMAFYKGPKEMRAAFMQGGRDRAGSVNSPTTFFSVQGVAGRPAWLARVGIRKKLEDAFADPADIIPQLLSHNDLHGDNGTLE